MLYTPSPACRQENLQVATRLFAPNLYQMTRNSCDPPAGLIEQKMIFFGAAQGCSEQLKAALFTQGVHNLRDIEPAVSNSGWEERLEPVNRPRAPPNGR